MQDNNIKGSNQSETNSELDDLSANYNLGMGSADSMSMSSGKKFFLISILLFIFILSGGLYYFLVYKNSKSEYVPIAETSLSFPNLNKQNENNYYVDKNVTNQKDKNEDVTEPDNTDLIHVWSKPVLGYVYKKDTYEVLYFLDKASGNIYKSTGPEYKSERLSKNSILNIKEGVFDRAGHSLAILKDGVLSVGRVPSVPESDYDLSNVIDDKVVHVYNNNFDNNFIYTKNENGGLGMYGYDTIKNKIFKVGFVPLTNIKIDWRSREYLYIITPPSDNYKQDILVFNIANGKLSSYISNDGDNIFSGSDIIYSQSSQLKYKNLKGKSYDLEVNTFADKCVFVGDLKIICSVPDTLYSPKIDYWYLGASRFRDSLYYFDLVKKDKKNFFDQSLISGEAIDGYNMAFNNKRLTMQNKNDDSLWLLDTESLLK